MAAPTWAQASRQARKKWRAREPLNSSARARRCLCGGLRLGLGERSLVVPNKRAQTRRRPRRGPSRMGFAGKTASRALLTSAVATATVARFAPHDLRLFRLKRAPRRVIQRFPSIAARLPLPAVGLGVSPARPTGLFSRFASPLLDLGLGQQLRTSFGKAAPVSCCARHDVSRRRRTSVGSVRFCSSSCSACRRSVWVTSPIIIALFSVRACEISPGESNKVRWPVPRISASSASRLFVNLMKNINLYRAFRAHYRSMATKLLQSGNRAA